MLRTIRSFDCFELDITDAQAPFLCHNNDLVEIKPTALRLLVLLTSRPGVFGYDQIRDDIWNGDLDVTDNGIQKHAEFLRKALAKAGGKGNFLTNVRGGYVFSQRVLEKDVERKKEQESLDEFSLGPTPSGDAHKESTHAGGELDTITDAQSKRWLSSVPHRCRQLSWRKRLVLILVCATVLGSGSLYIAYLRTTAPSAPSIFVIPVMDHSAQSGNQSVADGITDELVTGIDKSARGKLFVFPLTESIQYKSKNATPQMIHDRFGANYVLSTAFHDNGIGLVLDVRLYRMDGKPDRDPYIDSFPTDAKSMQSIAAGILAGELVHHILQESPASDVSDSK